MSETAPHPDTELASKIATLVAEKGWNQEEFARISNLNRHTVRQILQQTDGRRLRNTTVAACATALNLTVHELRTMPLDRLLPRMRQLSAPPSADDRLRRLYDQATQPELRSWVERNPERARQLTAHEIEELLALQGAGGPLTSFGVEAFVEKLERRRILWEHIQAIARTEYLELLENLVELMYDKVRPDGRA